MDVCSVVFECIQGKMSCEIHVIKIHTVVAEMLMKSDITCHHLSAARVNYFYSGFTR